MIAQQQQALVLSNLLVFQVLLRAAGSKALKDIQSPVETPLILGNTRALLQGRIREAVLLHRPTSGQWRCPAHLGMVTVSGPPTIPTTAGLHLLP
jgi:hypothetical protein